MLFQINRKSIVFYSESGYAAITAYQYCGSFAPQDETGDGRWAHQYDMMSDIFVHFTETHTGEKTSVAYFYPYYREWEDHDYLLEINGVYYQNSQKQAAEFDIEDGILYDFTIGDGHLVIPDSVNEIDVATDFFNNPKIISVAIPGSIKICDANFSLCHNLQSVTIGEGVQQIGLFIGCENLKEVILPESLVTIEEKAFAQCKSLDFSTLKLSANLREFTHDSLQDVQNVPEAILDETKSVLLSVQRNIITYTIPQSVRYLGKKAFKGCQQLTQITFPQGLEIIEEKAFEDCTQLQEIVLPETLTEIHADAFTGCAMLQTIRFGGAPAYVDKNAFKNCQKLEKIILPAAAKTQAEAAFNKTLLQLLVFDK